MQQQYEDFRNLRSNEGKFIFTKAKYYGFTYLIFGFFCVLFIALTFGFTKIDIFTRINNSQWLDSTVIILPILLVYMIVMMIYGFFSYKWKPVTFMVFTSILMLFTSLVLSLLVSFIWSYYDLTATVNLGSTIAILGIPAGIMMLAGVIGFIPNVKIDRWYYLLGYASLAAGIVFIVSLFVLHTILIVLIATLMTIVYFGLSIVEMHLMKKRAQFLDMVGNSVSTPLIARACFESAYRLFNIYTTLVYYITILVAEFK